MTYTMHYDSPLGKILLAADEEGLTGVWLETQKHFAAKLPPEHEEGTTPVLGDACRWLDVYFSGREPDFTPKLHLIGSDFRQAVWALLLQIPYGQTATYGALAKQLAEINGGKTSRSWHVPIPKRRSLKKASSACIYLVFPIFIYQYFSHLVFTNASAKITFFRCKSAFQRKVILNHSL